MQFFGPCFFLAGGASPAVQRFYNFLGLSFLLGRALPAVLSLGPRRGPRALVFFVKLSFFKKKVLMCGRRPLLSISFYFSFFYIFFFSNGLRPLLSLLFFPCGRSHRSKRFLFSSGGQPPFAL